MELRGKAIKHIEKLIKYFIEMIEKGLIYSLHDEYMLIKGSIESFALIGLISTIEYSYYNDLLWTIYNAISTSLLNIDFVI